MSVTPLNLSPLTLPRLAWLLAGGSRLPLKSPCWSFEPIERPIFRGCSRHRPARSPGSADGRIFFGAPSALGERLEFFHILAAAVLGPHMRKHASEPFPLGIPVAHAFGLRALAVGLDALTAAALRHLVVQGQFNFDRLISKMAHIRCVMPSDPHHLHLLLQVSTRVAPSLPAAQTSSPALVTRPRTRQSRRSLRVHWSRNGLKLCRQILVLSCLPSRGSHAARSRPTPPRLTTAAHRA